MNRLLLLFFIVVSGMSACQLKNEKVTQDHISISQLKFPDPEVAIRSKHKVDTYKDTCIEKKHIMGTLYCDSEGRIIKSCSWGCGRLKYTRNGLLLSYSDGYLDSKCILYHDWRNKVLYCSYFFADIYEGQLNIQPKKRLHAIVYNGDGYVLAEYYSEPNTTDITFSRTIYSYDTFNRLIKEKNNQNRYTPSSLPFVACIDGSGYKIRSYFYHGDTLKRIVGINHCNEGCARLEYAEYCDETGLVRYSDLKSEGNTHRYERIYTFRP